MPSYPLPRLKQCHPKRLKHRWLYRGTDSANLKWDQSGKVLVEIGTTSLKKDDVVQTKLKQGSLTLQLDPENKPVSSHWKSTHTDVHLPQAKLHLEDVQIEKY